MIKVKDGYAKLIGTTYQGSSTNVLLSNGGNFPIHSSRNNEANKLVRTDSNGFLQTGWINTTSGDMGTGTITKIYCSNDSYIRYQTPANFFSSLTNSGNNISITVAGQNRTLQVGYASNSDKVDNRHAISTTPNTGILYKSALYTPASLSSYWVKLASISSIGQNAEFVATIHVQSGHANLGRSAILLVYLRGDKSSFMSKSFKICCNSNYDPSRFRLYYRDSDKTSEIWYQTIGRWDGIITTVISQSDERALYEGLTLYNGHINVVQTPSMSSYITAQVSTITDNISGNATTASQLQTPRTLWGQSFNGTANVSGNIINTQSIKSVSNRYLDLYGSSGVAFYTNDSVKAVVSSSGNFGIGTTSPSYKLHVNGNAYISSTLTMSGDILLNQPSSTGTRQIRMACGDNDYARIAAGATDSNAGWLEIATADDANEPIYVRQYSGVFTTIKRTLTLLDGSGNTITPGYVTSTGFKKSGSSDSYVLLGGGGHKTIDSFQTNYDGRYVKKSGDMMTGTLTTYTNGSNNYNQGIRINRLAFSNWATLTIGYIGTSTGGTSDNTWLIGTPANSNSLIFTRNGASETSGLCLKGGGNTDIRWNGNTVWHAGNGGSGSGLDSDMLDGQHASAFSYKSWWHWSGQSGQPSWIWGGNSENNYYVYNPSNFSVNYAKSAGNADTLDNWHLSYILKDGCITSGTAGLASYWIKMWDYTLNSQYNDIDITLYVHSAYNQLWGIIALRLRQNGTGTARNITANLTEIIGNIPSDRFRLYYNNSNGLCQLWGNVSGQYNVFNYRVLAKTWRTATESTAIGTFYTSSITTAQTLPADSYVTITNLSLVNNTATSTKLQTARKINGTSFDGTSDITTSAWGATRTISLTGAVTGSVQTNGSGNITISTTYGTGNITNLDNRYLKKTGDTMNGTLSFSPTNSSDAAPKIYSTVSGDLTSLNFEVADDANDRFVFRINYWDDTSTTNRERFIIDWNNVVSKAPITAPSFKGNATSATQLQTSRKINGTSFNGTADITTSYWGATRTISLTGAITGSVSTNGSGNITINTTYDTGNITDLDNRYVRKTGDTMSGNLSFNAGKLAAWSAKGTSYITNGNANSGTSLGGDLANLVISSWNGVSFTTSCSGQTYTGKTAVGINCRNGFVYAAKFIGTLQGNASTATNADKLDGVHLNGIFTEFSYSQSKLTSTIGTVSKSVNITGSYPGVSNVSMNTIASYGNCMGMADLTGTSTLVNPNGQTSWHHFINLSYNTESSNMWQTQFAIKAGTTEVWVRSRSGGYVSDSVKWDATWVRLARVTDNVASASKLGTSTVGGTDKPIYLNGGTPVALSSTKGSATLPVYLNAGTITACTPSSVFSNLSNSGTKLSISVAGQNRTLTVMYATSTQYVVSSGRQTALSGTTAANSGIRLYEAYNNGYPISYGNLLSMKGQGSTELLMGWKSGANRMYYRSNSDMNEGWTSWQTVATLADVSNAVKTGTTGNLAYYSSASSISSFNSNVGNPYTPIYLSSGVPKPCNGVIITQFADYDIYCNSSNATFMKAQGNFSPVQSVTRISAGLVRIQFSVNPSQFKIILVPLSTRDNGFKQRYVTDYAGYDVGSGKVNTIVVGISDDYSRNDGSFHMYIFNFDFLF